MFNNRCVRCVCLIGLFLTTIAHAFAIENLVELYLPRGDWKPCELREVAVDSSERILNYNETDLSVAVERRDDSDFYEIRIQFRDKLLRTSMEWLGPGKVQVFVESASTQLDRVVAVIASGSGCGLAAEWRVATLIGFRDGEVFANKVKAMGIGLKSFVRLEKGGEFRFIFSTHHSMDTKDGSVHSFWCHQLLKREHERLMPDSKLAPIWIQHLKRENHEPTSLRFAHSGTEDEFSKREAWYN